jgi:uncharacterized protein
MGLLIVFTRYPRAGQAKTRLIPALGAAGASDLQRRMTEHVLVQARDWGGAVAIYYANGLLTELRDWLGPDLLYQPQSDGDLGARMAEAFGSQSGPTVIIGTDCPGIDGDLIRQAFAVLEIQDLVLGPALDGGYYLIGLNKLGRIAQPWQNLFQNIDWSTDRVLAQTLAVAKALDLKTQLLGVLPDIDRPEDLVHLPCELP